MKFSNYLNLKNSMKEDYLNLKYIITSFSWFNWKRNLLYIFIFIFMPFIPFILLNIIIYKYLIKYIFIIVDIVILDFLFYKIKDTNIIYSYYINIRKILWFIFYSIFFEKLPQIFFWFLDKFTLSFWIHSFFVIILAIIEWFVQLGYKIKFYFRKKKPFIKRKIKYVYKMLYTYFLFAYKTLYIYINYIQNKIVNILYIIYYFIFDIYIFFSIKKIYILLYKILLKKNILYNNYTLYKNIEKNIIWLDKSYNIFFNYNNKYHKKKLIIINFFYDIYYYIVFKNIEKKVIYNIINKYIYLWYYILLFNKSLFFNKNIVYLCTESCKKKYITFYNVLKKIKKKLFKLLCIF